MYIQDYELESALEIAQVTSLPIKPPPGFARHRNQQYGNSIGATQSILVLGVTHSEEVKTAELLHSDQGGLVYQPIAGLHESVGMIDFISLYQAL